MAFEVRLLGAVEALGDGVAVELGHARQRCVLVALAVEANRPVSYDQLVTRVWGDAPPRQPRAALYGYLYRLRQVLSDVPDVALARVPGCYRMVVDPDAVDLHRFERLVARARRAEDDARRVALYDEALALWRGEAFTGLDTPWLSTVRMALEQQRSVAEADRTDAALRLGRHQEVLAVLTARTAAHPLDERLAGQLMLALHGLGRTAEALAVYQRVRRRLAEELGADPGEALRAVHRRVLQTPVLTVTPAPTWRAVVTPVTRLPVEATTSAVPGPRW
ncbi:AfsR/SARP family transcriptional regulator [Saccharothrix coeruleofusca]|uniref:DNA-binding SARP family transcriptional activator n=1 Tax=Saccharothrix coeruleofusca TaxID=33919 RepID=A0A918AL56_9PSEU|nr:AfsR/SARP family transcriptional regulator [Saccharothrix coeruleofusca]MBP2336129.1 DNA-binding SARP family transcriptional activator [Saccharothrix coeruleofusca]GGP55208.1 hypothetical protein GCM10010185_29700 [Saccharothrix coeruleofusca]